MHLIHPNNSRITQGFGSDFRYFLASPPEWKNKWFYKEIIGGMQGHNGIDYGCPVNSRVIAPCKINITGLDGSNATGYGINLWARTDTWEENGKTVCWEMVFGHLNSFKPGLKVGDVVQTGDLIALSGNTGKFTTGAHLHWGVRKLFKNGSAWNIDNYNNGYFGYFDQNEFIDYKQALPYLDGKVVYAGSQVGAQHFYFDGRFNWITDEYAFSAGNFLFTEAVQVPAEFIQTNLKEVYQPDWSKREARVAKQLMSLLVYNPQRAKELWEKWK